MKNMWVKKISILAMYLCGLLMMQSISGDWLLANDTNTGTTPLTFNERINCRKIVESVYWEHRIWPKENASPKPSFDAIMPDELMRDKVEEEIQKTNAIEAYWKKPITGEMLQAEMNRIAHDTKKPEIIHEIWDALNNDPFMIAECFVRPILADRLIRGMYASDSKMHGALRAKAESELAVNSIYGMHNMSGEYAEIEYRIEKKGDAAIIKKNRSMDIIYVDDNEFRQIEASLEQSGTVQEDEHQFYISRIVNKSADRIKAEYRIWAKESFDQWWRLNRNKYNASLKPLTFKYGLPGIAVNPCVAGPADTWFPTQGPPDHRVYHTAIWTGTEMIIWGGALYSGIYLNNGARYNPGTDTWVMISTAGAPTARRHHTAVWTGSEMIIWGGFPITNTGGRYNPVSDSWVPTSLINAPPARDAHIAVWTGSEMIIWGGGGGASTSGGRYAPGTDTWTVLPTANAPAPRSLLAAVWTGTDMIVWGGTDYANYHNDGGVYNLGSNSWSSMAISPSARAYHTAVWTGSEMIIWGGLGPSGYLNTGARYNPGNNTWTATDTATAPGARAYHAAIWNANVSGNEMIIWGGFDGTTYLNTGGRYSPGTNSWTATNTASAPLGRSYLTAVWTNTEMIIWGGGQGGNYFASGARYNPATDSWIATSYNGAPAPRRYHTAVWTGTEMIIWGGGDLTPTNTGGKYNLSTDSWTPTSIINAPSARSYHSAVWTGLEMIIWGGSGASNTGSRYNVTTDSWTVTSTAGAPNGRIRAKAAWSGSAMVIWGGDDGCSGFYNTGGRYYPGTDSWLLTSTINAPEGRWDTTAVWTNSEMIIWGGINGANTGARYNPSTDKWISISTANAPEPRSNHIAVWTGSRMLIWGGYEGLNYFYKTGIYNPSTDTWTSTAINNALPDQRYYPTAIWTGDDMIVWGGASQTGARFNYKTNYWTPTSMVNAPLYRWLHTAVWADDAMIIWGGAARGAFGTGGIYCTPCMLSAPGSITATATGSNQVTVQWSAVTGATSYNVYRLHTQCGEAIAELVANNVSGNTYIDNTVQGTIMYEYRVSAVGSCESLPSDAASVTATGDCALSPCFKGIKNTTNDHLNSCALTLQWDSATSSCSSSPDITYTVYRSTDPAFTPNSSTLLATCLNSTSYQDIDVASVLTFYYIVRAEDNSLSHGGPCIGGNVDSNLKKIRNAPTGPVSTTLFSDGFESGMSNWTISSNWIQDNVNSHTGTYSAFSGNLNEQACDTLALTNPVAIPATGYTQLHFWNWNRTETLYDFGIIEGSSNGSTWTQLMPSPDYPEMSSPWEFECLGLDPFPAFTGNYTDWTEYTVDLTPYAGSNFYARYNVQTDQCINIGGWRVDDVRIDVASSCVNNSPNCSTPPLFAGAGSTNSPSTSTCQIDLNWSSASSTCPAGPNITYHIYRSTDPAFVPSPSNRIAFCVTGTTFADTDIQMGTRYYYIVRAEDSMTNGSGPCNSGNTDSNLVRINGTPTGAWFNWSNDNFESGLAQWTTSGLWNWSTAQAHSGTYSAHSGSGNNQCDVLTMANWFSPPAHSTVHLLFWTKFAIENGWDGGILQVTTDDISWSNIDLDQNYPGMTNATTTACVGTNLECFSGNGGWTVYGGTGFNFTMGPIKLRFLYGTNESNSLEGWYIDDFDLKYSYCTPSTAPGTVPDNDNYPGIPLTISKAGNNLALNWSQPGSPCQTADYGIYRGALPWSGYNHAYILCSTSATTSIEIPQDINSYYYLVVAQNANQEGSYGLDSANNQRPPGTLTCYPQSLGFCN